jgi:hypothetical protein
MSPVYSIEPRTFGRLHMGQFGSKGGLQRIAPLKSGRNVPPSPSNKTQTSVRVTPRDSSAKTT